MFIAPLARVVSVNSGSLQLLVCASSDDLTNRTGEVSWGNLQKGGRDPFDIPLRGRSTRSWLIGINSWITWAGHLIVKEERNGDVSKSFAHLGLACPVQSHRCLALGEDATHWKADLGLLFCCLAPDTERYLLLIPKDICVGLQAPCGAYAVMLVFIHGLAGYGTSRMSYNTVHIPLHGIG